jgi:mycothiol synthase
VTSSLIERTPRTWLTRVGADRLPAAVAEVAAQGGGPLRWWVTEPGDADTAAARAAGLAPERELLQLRTPLPLPRSTVDAARHATVRPFMVGEDEDAWLDVNNRAFDWHPEQGGWTRSMLLAREQEPWFDPAGFLLHWDDETGRLAGSVWTKVHPAADGDPPMGEIFVISVDPDFGGRGLGRALTVAGFEWLHRERAIEVGMLYVEVSNTPAMKLYADLGMTRHHADHAYYGEIPGPTR